MVLDDVVIVLADPFAWGYGLIYAFTSTGHIVVEFTDGTVAQFHAHELELHSAWEAGNGESLTGADLDQLRKANA